MPPFTVGAFRTAFPEFADTVKYPDEMINLWANLAQIQVIQRYWKRAWLMGVYLYTAHEITIQAQNVNLTEKGGVPGTTGGIPSNKAVGSASIGFDPSSTTEKDAGYWNQTTYGKQFIHLARIFGAGAIQLNGNCFPFGVRFF